MLANYYDKSKADEFEDTFGQLYIGRRPTRDRSSLLVLVFDFSSIPALAKIDETRRSLNQTINETLAEFLRQNKQYLLDSEAKDYILDYDASGSLFRVFVSRYHVLKPSALSLTNIW
jgi:hypothetical protein